MEEGPKMQFIIKLLLTRVMILFLTGCKLGLSNDLNIGDLLRSALSKKMELPQLGLLNLKSVQ
jgi:hypothetical protein